MIISSVTERLVFDNARTAIVRAFDSDQPGTGEQALRTGILTQGDLRFEQALVANQNLYTFQTLDQANSNSTNMEDRLKLQDAFVISSLFIGPGAPSSATDNTFLPDTYANQIKYSTAGAAAALQAIWNAGLLKITVNNRVILPKWSLYRHYNAAQTQQTAALGSGSPMDQTEGASNGWYPVEPNITLIGQKNSVLEITIKGAGLAAIQANSRLIIMAKGVLAQNLTVIS